MALRRKAKPFPSPVRMKASTRRAAGKVRPVAFDVARASPCLNAQGGAKRGYISRQIAKAVIRGMGDPTLAPYLCGNCGYFHVGHPRYKGKGERP